MPTVSEIPTQHGPTDASGHLPTPRLLEVLTNKRLSPTAKVLYSLLDELGQGQPVVLNQSEMGQMLDTSRKTITIRLGELRELGLIAVTVHQTRENRHALGYATRTPVGDGPLYLVPFLSNF